VFSAIAEEPETVARSLVPRIRAVRGTGKYVRFLTIPRAVGRLAAAFLLGVNATRHFEKDGTRVKKEGMVYRENGSRDLSRSEKAE